MIVELVLSNCFIANCLQSVLVKELLKNEKCSAKIWTKVEDLLSGPPCIDYTLQSRLCHVDTRLQLATVVSVTRQLSTVLVVIRCWRNTSAVRTAFFAVPRPCHSLVCAFLPRFCTDDDDDDDDDGDNQEQKKSRSRDTDYEYSVVRKLVT